MITFFKKAWLWIKKHWKIFALILGAVVGFVLFRGKNISFSEDFNKIKDNHAEELRKIDEARAEERRLAAENAARLESTLKTIEDEYSKKKQELDGKKKQEITRIVKESGDDPDELARRLSEATGFQVILPTD
jgi:hypothetical protein